MVPMEADMALKNTEMLYGDYMFLFTTLLKLYGAINVHYGSVSKYFE